MESGLTKRLSYRILYVVVATFLPMNVLAILVSGLVLSKSTNQFKESYQRKLDIAMDSYQYSVMEFEERYDDFVREYVDELTLTEQQDNMILYSMLNDVKDIFEVTGMVGFAYLVHKATEQEYIKYTENYYAAQQIDEIKNQLIELGWPIEPLVEGQIVHVGEQYFIVKQFQYLNYDISLFLDIQGNISSKIGSELLSESTVHISSNNNILQLLPDDISETKETWTDIFRKKFLSLVIFWQGVGDGPMVGVKISRENYLGATELLYWLLFFVSLGSIGLLYLLWKLLEHRVVIPLNRLKTAMNELESENLVYRIDGWSKKETADFIYLYDAFNSMAKEIEVSKEKELEMYKVQLENLRLQVNPHMLLNSLNMIYSLAQTRNYQYIQEFSLYLVDYFRYTLRENSNFVTLRKEMNFIKSYIEIQRIRFPDMFSCVYDIRSEVELALIPPLLIQNFIENAMKYALVPGRIVEILINARMEDGRLYISIIDTGRGIDAEVLELLNRGQLYVDKNKKEHLGIWNCRKRMEVFYGEVVHLNMISKLGEGTQVWIDVPLLLERSEGDLL